MNEKTEKLETRRLFTLAAKLIEKYGWTRGEYEDHGGAFCLIGALDQAATTLYQGWWLHFHSHKLVNDRSAIIHWNDHIAKNKRQVVRLLRRLAKST